MIIILILIAVFALGFIEVDWTFFGLWLLPIMMIIMCFVNEDHTKTIINKHSIIAVNNTSKVEGHGGLFTTRIEEEDYLVFWQDKKTHLERKQIQIDWDTTKVFETLDKDPVLEVTTTKPIKSFKWFLFDLLDRSVNSYSLYVPPGTVIRQMELQ